MGRETGFLTTEKNWQAIAEYISTLVKNSQLREDFAVAGRKQIAEKFNLQSHTKQLEVIYDEFLSN